MPGQKHHRGLSAMLFLGAVLLLLFASTFPYSGKASITTSTAIHEAAVKLGFKPAAIKVAIPFGKKDGWQALVEQNATKSDHRHGLRKRDLTWEDALTKGQGFLNKLSGPRQQSPWTTIQQLEDNGWTFSASDDTETDYFADPYKEFNIEQTEGVEVLADQDKPFPNCNNEHTAATQADYTNVFNVPGKTIVANVNFSPAYIVSQRNRDLSSGEVAQRVPQVFRWSDVTWVIWADQAKARAGSLKYIFRHNCVTEATRAIIEIAAGVGVGSFSAEWPGIEYRKGTEGFQALLGTPHGKGVVWLVVDHPNEMPGKDIESITMFTTPATLGGAAYCLLFTLTGEGN